MTQDQVYVPRSRSELGLPPLDPTKEDLAGSSVTEDVKQELWEALGDSPIGIFYFFLRYLVSLGLSAVSFTVLMVLCRSSLASLRIFWPMRPGSGDTLRARAVRMPVRENKPTPMLIAP